MQSAKGDNLEAVLFLQNLRKPQHLPRLYRGIMLVLLGDIIVLASYYIRPGNFSTLWGSVLYGDIMRILDLTPIGTAIREQRDAKVKTPRYRYLANRCPRWERLGVSD